MRRLYWVYWFFWVRPRLSYRLDRAFGWSRWRAWLRCWNPGPKLLYPPGTRPQTRHEVQNQAEVDYAAQKTELFRELQAMRDKAIADSQKDGRRA